MAEPVRIRGEVGERRKGREVRAIHGVAPYQWSAYTMPDDPLDPKAEYWDGRSHLGAADRRGLAMLTPPNVAARIDAIIQATREPLIRALEEAQDEIADLHATLDRYRKAIDTAAKHAYRVELERAGEAEAKLASGQPEGCYE